MAKSWKDVTPNDREWEIKLKLDRNMRRLNTTFAIIGVLFVLAFVAHRIWFRK
jgi:hypothetical protein